MTGCCFPVRLSHLRVLSPYNYTETYQVNVAQQHVCYTTVLLFLFFYDEEMW